MPLPRLEHFRAGDDVILRELWQGRVWSVRPVTVVEDSTEAIVVYTPADSTGLFPTDSQGRPLRIPADTWTLGERVATDHHVLGIQVPGDHHGTLLIWDADWKFRSWYINLEEPFQRTAIGFDYKDNILDIVVRPDLSSWRWKDEDELEEAVAKSVYTAQQAREFRAEGERALMRLLAREPPLDKAWEGWRPDAGWAVPQLRPGWQQT